MDLATIKSANVIDEPSKIESALIDAHRKITKTNSNAAVGFEVSESPLGGVQVRKASALGLGIDASNTPDKAMLAEVAQKAGMDWKDGDAARVIPWWASDERVDRHGDIVRQNWDMVHYADNPVVLWSHSWDALPIGRTMGWEVVQSAVAGYKGPALRLLPYFGTEDTYKFADTVYRLAKAKLLTASSVGFSPGKIIDVQDKKERAELGLGAHGYVLDQNLLLEWSPTSIPANPGAIQNALVARKAGLLRGADVDFVRELRRREVQRGEGDVAKWMKDDENLIRWWRQLFPDVSRTVHKSLDEPIAEPSENDDEPAPVVVEGQDEEQDSGPTLKDIADQLGAIKSAIDDLRDRDNKPPVKDNGGESNEGDAQPNWIDQVMGATGKAREALKA